MPCDAEGQHNTKCEWCEGGAQDNTNFTKPLENERCHYVVPGTGAPRLAAAVSIVVARMLVQMVATGRFQ